MKTFLWLILASTKTFRITSQSIKMMSKKTLRKIWKIEKIVKLGEKWRKFVDFWYSAYRPAWPNIRPNNIGRNWPNIRPNIRYRSYASAYYTYIFFTNWFDGSRKIHVLSTYMYLAYIHYPNIDFTKLL